jgi:Ca2+-binding EF-hand superfamily protein
MKRTALIATVIVSTVGLFNFSSFSEEKGKGERPDLRKLDKNNDRAISQEEAGPEIWSRLGKLDKNNDGQVSGDELPRPGGGKGGPGEGGKGNPGEMMKQLDKNGDGSLSKEEVPAQAWERIGKLDKNNDNTVSREEFAAAVKDRVGSGDFFGNMDKNGDGKLTENEVPQAWERISKADRDKDGAVSREEMGAARAMMEKSGGKGPGGPGPDGGPRAIFERYDGDKDGKLTKEEVPGEMWARLSKADDDADGRVSREEMAKVYEKMEAMNPGKKDDAPKRPALEKTEV